MESVNVLYISGLLHIVAERCMHYIRSGFYVNNCDAKIDWPYFWRRRYTVELVGPVVSVYLGSQFIGVTNPIDFDGGPKVTSKTSHDFEFQGLYQFGEQPSILKPLEQQLSEAVEKENYELAARLRDQINGKV